MGLRREDIAMSQREQYNIHEKFADLIKFYTSSF
jgi:hypothetical protein